MQGADLRVTVPPYNERVTFHNYAPGRIGGFTFGNGTIWTGAQVDDIANGTMTAFSFSMTQVAEAFVESVKKEETTAPVGEPKQEEKSASSGCDTGAGAALLLFLAAWHCRKRK
jgi:hypothetical protein